MNLRLLTLSLAFVLMASLNPKIVAAAVPVVAVAEACGESDLSCIRLLLLQKQDEVLSFGKRVGLVNQQVELLKQTVDMVNEQLVIALSSNKTLLEAANKLVPHWYQSPLLWFGIGVFIGGGLVVLTAYAVAQVLTHP